MAHTTIVGNLVDAPELKYTPSGDAVANVTVAHQRRKFNPETKEWEDKGEPLFLRGSLWRQQAENAAETYNKGDRVIVTGELIQRSYEAEGQKRYVVELDIFDIGASTRYASAKITKNAPKGTANGTPPPEGYRGKGKAKADDPWGDVPPPEEPTDPPF